MLDSGMSVPNDAGENQVDAGMNGGCSSDMECAPPRTVCEMGLCVSGCADTGGLVCGQDEVCDTNTGRCVNVSGPCMSDSECNSPSEVCESGQCVPGCGQPGGIQCSGNTACNMMTGRCEMANLCLRQAVIPPQTICNQNNGQCEPGCDGL